MKRRTEMVGKMRTENGIRDGNNLLLGNPGINIIENGRTVKDYGSLISNENMKKKEHFLTGLCIKMTQLISFSVDPVRLQVLLRTWLIVFLSINSHQASIRHLLHTRHCVSCQEHIHTKMK